MAVEPGSTAPQSTIGQLIESLPGRSTPAQLRGFNAVVQVRSTGASGGEWVIVAKDGVCTVRSGKEDAADLTVSASADVWASLLSRKLDPAWAYMSGQLQVSGDIGLAMRLQSVLFG